MELKNVKFKDIASFKYGSMQKENYGTIPIFSGYSISGYTNNSNVNNETLIVVCRGVGGTGDVKLTPSKCWVTNLSIICEVDESKVNYKYLYYYLLSQNNRMKKLDTGSCQAQITIEQLGLFELLLPPLYIQNKIVDILANIDNQIKRNNDMVQKLQSYKPTISCFSKKGEMRYVA